MLAEIVFSRLSLTGFQLAPVSYLYSSKYRSQIFSEQGQCCILEQLLRVHVFRTTKFTLSM